MERHAFMEERYGEAIRKLDQAKELLKPESDPEIPGLNQRLFKVNEALDQVQAEVSSICNEVGRLAVQGR